MPSPVVRAAPVVEGSVLRSGKTLRINAQLIRVAGDIPLSLGKAADLFHQVIAKDPAFAPAHAGLANAYAHMSVPSGSPIPFETAQPIIRAAAVKALELDPLLADAHAAMGWVYSRELEWSSAEKAFQRAIELNPSLTQTYTSYSTSTLRPLGKPDDALRLLRCLAR
jgi:tetratricopeptide (TPR) repeat protein